MVVGGSPASRGVVATASYEARKYGVRSAMPMAQALRLCPQAIQVFPNFQAYRETSLVLRRLFLELTPLVEPLSLDEAYLDVSGKVPRFAEARALGESLKQQIRETTQLTASVGIAPNKYLAKVASDHQKPDGLFMVEPREVLSFLAPLPIRVIPGVGPKTEKRFQARQVNTIADLREWSVAELQQEVGEKYGLRLYELARGNDHSPVIVERPRKSLSTERTFAEDLIQADQVREMVRSITREVVQRMAPLQLKGRTVGIKLRYPNFQIITRAITLDHRTASEEEIARHALALLDTIDLSHQQVRLVGVRLAGFEEGTDVDLTEPSGPDPQLWLW